MDSAAVAILLAQLIPTSIVLCSACWNELCQQISYCSCVLCSASVLFPAAVVLVRAEQCAAAAGEPALSDTAELVGQGPDAQQAAEEGTDAAEEAVQTNTAELVGQGRDAQQAAEESPLTTR